MGTSWLLPSAFIGLKLADYRDGAAEKQCFGYVLFRRRKNKARILTQENGQNQDAFGDHLNTFKLIFFACWSHKVFKA